MLDDTERLLRCPPEMLVRMLRQILEVRCGENGDRQLGRLSAMFSECLVEIAWLREENARMRSELEEAQRARH